MAFLFIATGTVGVIFHKQLGSWWWRSYEDMKWLRAWARSERGSQMFVLVAAIFFLAIGIADFGAYLWGAFR